MKTLAVQNYVVIRDGSPEVVEKVQFFVRIQPFWFLLSLVSNVSLKNAENWIQKPVYMRKKSNRNDLPLSCPLQSFSSFPCAFFQIPKKYKSRFYDTWLDSVSKPRNFVKVNVIVPLRVKLKHYAVFTKCCRGIGRLDIISSREFSPKISRNCRKWLVPNNIRFDQRKKL